MAEAVVFGIAEKILTDLGSYVLQDIGSALGVKKELKKLNKTIITIKAVLLHAEELHLTNPEVRTWLRRIKDATYEADDIIDDFAIEALRNKLVIRDNINNMVRNFASSSNPILFRFKMSHRIKEIREKLNEIQADRSFHLETRIEYIRLPNSGRANTHSHVDESRVYGRECDKENIVALLLDLNGNDNLSNISIQGMGGVGKTTLAKLVYKDERVASKFKTRMWVCVTEEFDVKKITEKMIKSVTNNECPNLEMDQLQSRLREQLRGKRFLLVLDDVWNEDVEKWDELKDLLIGGARGSKLFKTRAFETGQEEENQKLVEIGKEIVKKCGGIPLAAKTLGSFMRFKTKEHEWVYVKNSDVWKLPQKENDILPALRLTYNHFSFSLRQCFAYCSIFPKGFRIHKEDLIQLWIVQGFIHSSGQNQSLEDIGSEYVEDLMWRSFFQEPEVSGYQNLISFKMHDLVHDLAQFVAGVECFTVHKDANVCIPEGVRHLRTIEKSISSVTKENLSKFCNIRTLIVKCEFISSVENIFSSFKFLRVLALQLFFEIESLPSSIGDLKHLRYLEISSDGIITTLTLPKSITKLQRLQTFKSTGGCRIRELPTDISPMAELRHIVLDEDVLLSHMPSGLGKLTSLQTLSVFVVGDGIGCKLNELNELMNLKGKLTIKNLENMTSARDSEAANLKGKSNLETLKFVWNENVLSKDVNQQDIAADVLETLRPPQGSMVKERSWFPSLKTLHLLSVPNLVLWSRTEEEKSVASLPCLVDLTIYDCPKLKTMPLLPSLEKCKLYICSQKLIYSLLKTIPKTNPTSSSTIYSLATLKSLEIGGCGDLVCLPEKVFQGLSCLVSLTILDCKSLNYLSGMQYLTALESLDLVRCKELHMLQGMDGLTSLQTLVITHITKLASIPEGLQNCTKLHTLLIRDCESLKALPLATSLRYLAIIGCESLLGWPNGLRNLTLLTCLGISCSSNMPSLTEELHLLTALSSLVIVGVKDMITLPEWLRSIIFLRHLHIYDCPDLECLPQWMECLTALEELKIGSCYHLTSRCQKDRGEDWPKISHVPIITIDGMQIQ
ncbi:hypothetical protein AQUCO_05400036v1 [Aquilegia coerulea]|uniref:Uncharacterized protein n=1 Tax=Aquilegia coerulea TaxID=218851 RepID=A0A2G5CIJ0_AQUCA|nr:hypothetical protein AQUCO_05400036v1 [Aquilegia coerulea]